MAKFEDYDDDALVPDRIVREHCGVVAMTIFRWDHNPTLAFPKPKVINNRKYRRKCDVVAWIASRPDRAAPPPCARKSIFLPER
jgi:hypothetical protein